MEDDCMHVCWLADLHTDVINYSFKNILFLFDLNLLLNSKYNLDNTLNLQIIMLQASENLPR